ncbi:MAG: hypothetical protein A2Z69_00555 [Bacteroidetes bacterium RBG_13_44_24]|nr:MAG: hypothetical protein A2Z69_00555 [Bacteroidetes bacterium RBG_13_44_24]
MIKDELTAIENYVRELEAIKDFPHTKAQRDLLLAENTTLKDRVKQLTRDDSTARKTLIKLSKREAEVKDLTRKLDELHKKLSALEGFKVTLSAGESTLEKMRREFIQAQNEEIEARTKERVEEAVKKLQSKMPDLVEREFLKVLNSSQWPPEMEKAVALQARKFTEEWLHDRESWPDWFKDYYAGEVKEAITKGLDKEFEKRVEAGVVSRLEDIKTHVWEQYSADKARQLSSNLRSMVTQLQGAWGFKCDRCGRNIDVPIGPTEIAQLLGDKTIEITCPSCFDQAPPPFFLNMVPHKVGNISFAKLLQGYLGEIPRGG